MVGTYILLDEPGLYCRAYGSAKEIYGDTNEKDQGKGPAPKEHANFS